MVFLLSVVNRLAKTTKSLPPKIELSETRDFKKQLSTLPVFETGPK